MSIRHPRRAARRNAVGVGLIEVLVAVVILAFGMLGIAALQSASLRNSQSALEHSQATVQTYAILDAMRANSAAARIHKYDLAVMTCNAPNAGDLAANDRRNWILSLKSTLGPSACGQITCGTDVCDIKVQWDDSRGTSANADEAHLAVTHAVETKTRL